jgi:protein TonB
MLLGRTNPEVRSSFRRVMLSVLLHSAVLAIFVYKGRLYVAPMLLPGDVTGTRLTLTYLPGRAAQSVNLRATEAEVPPSPATNAKLADPHLDEPARIPQPTVSPDFPKQSAASATNSTPSPNPDSTNGADSLGTGNINIAYLDSFRSPRPDLSALPRGASGDVVLDVTIDAAGRIIALKKLSGVGYGIDESVIATVQAWVFHPATKDGTPVVSEQELHFHYERRNG